MAGIGISLRQHRRIGLDTSVFIYHLEGVSRYEACTGVVFDELATGGFEGVSSVLTLMELAVRPLQLGRPDVANEYEVLVGNFPNLTITEIGRPTVRRAAELRARYGLRPADALQVAACLEHGATAFLTNDRDLRRVKEMQVILLEDFV
ncbi:MAG: type II toxin-antitoxin system VapC family toxin [Dehalococcoidia bacterium]|nr:type II toxin-antitoxin system VapC family toxin [Dehalococcoidia bacterium]